MFDRAASTIASESKLGCERTPRGAWDEKGWPPGAAAAAPLSPSVAADDEVEVDAPAATEAGAKGGSGGCTSAVKSNT